MLMIDVATKAAIMHNAHMKIYPDGSRSVLVCERSIFRESGWEERKVQKRISEPEPECEGEPDAAGGGGECDTSRSRRRARSAVSDLARCNDFKYFITFTLDSSRISRYDVVEITKHLNIWLDNRVRRKGLKYVLVPELHKDGAVHFHGMINDALPVTDSGTISRGNGKPRRPRSEAERKRWLAEGGHVVYNVGEWKFGFSTAIELYGDRRRAIGYVTKYVSKSAGKVGGRWYYSGGDLQRPKSAAVAADFEAAAALAGSCFTLDGLNCSCCRIDLSKEDYENVREALGIRGGFADVV